jgi:hypothetical protein
MNKFKVGDKVVALIGQVHPNAQPRVKGEIYTVIDVIFCSRDGHQLTNLGYKSIHHELMCSCGGKHPTRGLMWTNSEFFDKVDDVEEALEEAVATEDYELAVILRDINK